MTSKMVFQTTIGDNSAILKTMTTDSNHGAALDQIKLWTLQAHEACRKRRFITAFRFYHQALDKARRCNCPGMVAELCRDMAYVYLHFGATDKARCLLEEGLSIAPKDPMVRFGLFSNLASACLVDRDYRSGLEAVEHALQVVERIHPSPDRAPFALMASYAALYKLRRQLRRLVELLDSGIAPERIQVSHQLAPPPWKPEE